MYLSSSSPPKLLLAALMLANHSQAQSALNDGALKRMHREAFENSQADAIFGTLTP